MAKNENDDLDNLTDQDSVINQEQRKKQDQAQEENSIDTASNSKTKSMLSGFKAKTDQTQNNSKLTAENEKLSKEIEELKSKLEDYKDQALRAKAEAENTRRRTAKDIENAHKYGLDKFSRELLNVVDSMEHGIAAIDLDDSESSKEDSNTNIKSLLDGMKLTYKLLLDTLEKFEIVQIDPMGEVFDPAKHEALSMVPSEGKEANTIIQVVQKGYLQHDRVLRPARVILAK